MAEKLQSGESVNNKEEKHHNLLEKFANILDKIVVILSVLLTALLTINLFIAVFFRYVLNNPIYWADELSLLLFAWLTFLGACLAIRRSEMAAVTMILDRLTSTSRFVFDAIIQVSIIVFSVVMGYYSFLWIKSPSVLNMISSTLGIKLWWAYLIVPFSMICIFIFSINNFYRHYVEFRNEKKGAMNE